MVAAWLSCSRNFGMHGGRYQNNRQLELAAGKNGDTAAQFQGLVFGEWISAAFSTAQEGNRPVIADSHVEKRRCNPKRLFRNEQVPRLYMR